MTTSMIVGLTLVVALVAINAWYVKTWRELSYSHVNNPKDDTGAYYVHCEEQEFLHHRGKAPGFVIGNVIVGAIIAACLL